MVVMNEWWLVACVVVILVAVGVLIYFKKHPFQISSTHTIEPVDIGPNASRAFEKFGGGIGDVAQKVADSVGTVSDTVKPVTQGVGNVLSAVADRLSFRMKDLDEAETQKRSALQEIERLKARAINVTQIESQLKLALIQLNQNYTSIYRTTLESKHKEFYEPGGDWRTEFLGIQAVDYKVQVGIDIQKLKFDLDGQVIYVQGLRVIELIGFKDLGPRRVLAEIRQYTKSSTFGDGGVEVLASSDHAMRKADSRLEEYSNRHSNMVLDEIQEPDQLEHLAEVNAKMALAFLTICLSHSGYDVAELTDERELTMNFIELCTEINQRFSKLQDEQNSIIGKLDTQREALKSEMLQIASEG